MSPSLKCLFTIDTYSRDIALGQHIQDWKKCTNICAACRQCLEDVRVVERWCDSHHKPVGVDSHGSPTRCSNASTCSNKSLARQFFTTHGDHRSTCRIVAHCISRTGHVRKAQNRWFVIQLECGGGHIVESFTVEKVRFVLPLVLSFGDSMCFSSDFEV